MERIDGRRPDQLRPVEIIPGINRFAEGSCLIRCGNTHVLCTASVEDRTPPHVPEGEGWVTAEYSMLPRANRERSQRDIAPSPWTAMCSRETAAPVPPRSPADLWPWPWPAGS